MAATKEVATAASAEVATIDPAVQAILDAQNEEMEGLTLQVPILKLAQGTTKEVKNGDADAGEFIETLSGEVLGTEVDFIVSFFQKGRSVSLDDGRYFSIIAGPNDPVPERWADAVGEENVGVPFRELDCAEERHAAMANAKQIQWGKGPKVSTTYVYTGHVVIPVLDDDGAEIDTELRPVRLSLLRSTKKAHDRIASLKTAMLRNRPFWDRVLHLESVEKDFGRNTSYIIEPKFTRDTTPAEREAAVTLAQVAVAGRAVSNDAAEAPEAPVEPDAEGGLAV
jgi:hypothetical protein